MNLEAAEAVAVALVRKLRMRVNRTYQNKGTANLVTDHDRRFEQQLKAGLPASAAFWGEETGRSGEADWLWVVDPLDGTTNFVHGYPHAAVSVALAYHHEVQLGVVYDLYRKELFTARRGQGAFRNGKPIKVSQVRDLSEALLSTGFGPESSQEEYARFMRLQALTHGVRRSGCCSLDLCWVACGRLEAYYEWDLQPWDVAAGGLIVTEAGGHFTGLNGDRAHLESRHFLASNRRLHNALIERTLS